MPLFKRTLSEFLFRRFMLKHYSSNLLLDMNLEAKRDTLDYIKENGADLMVLGSHGHGMVASLLIGSVAEGMVRKAVVPTLVVPVTDN